MSFLHLKCVLILVVVTFTKNIVLCLDKCPGSNNTSSANTTISSGDIPLIQLKVESLKNYTHLTILPQIRFNCSASYPIQWSFGSQPHKDSLNTTRLRWNVSYIREAQDVFLESAELFSSIISFTNISWNQLRLYGLHCLNVKDHCQFSSVESLLPENKGDFVSANATATGTDQEIDEPIPNEKCKLDLWFDESSQLFFCKSKDGSFLPKMSFRYCANPTECGFSSLNNECADQGIRLAPKRCSKNQPNCQNLNVGAEFPIPKVISCWDEGQGEHSNSSVKLMGYFHSVKEVNGRPASSYINWEEADPADLISIQGSKQKVMANESFDVACSASYYYFAQGMHLTLKHLSDPSFAELDLDLLPTANLSTIKETLEIWNHSAQNSQYDSQFPLRRTLLAQGLLLPAGDYEFTCYAPVWNSTEWTTKMLMVSVSNTSVPVFITGNGTRSIDFVARKNITCLAKGIPPPKLTWIYKTEQMSSKDIFETNGETKFLSWSVITLPDNLEGFIFEFKCHAENPAGFDEKLFIINKDDESMIVSTKIAATVVMLGFVGNLIVGYFCWKHLFSEDNHEFAPVKFLRDLWNGRVPWCRLPCCRSKVICKHPKCRQQQTQTV